MIVWIEILKKDTLVYYLQVGLILCLIILVFYSLSLPLTSGLIPVIGIIGSVLGSIITAIIIVYFTISKSIINPIKITIENIHPEIITNISRLSKFEKQCDDLKGEWLKGNPQGLQSESGKKWLGKDPAESYNPANSIKYGWRYLKIGNYPIFYENMKLLELNGLGFNSIKLHQFWGFTQNCHNFCDEIQTWESTGNIYSAYIGEIDKNGVPNLVLPKIVLINNQYQKLGNAQITKAECELRINEINSKMKEIYIQYMELFNPVFEMAKDSSSQNFFDSLFP